ncbi:Serine/threonine-protein phosphatase 2A activator [Hondaea fermentalgiana]|uniref:Serine/threonine-protein phosphatase 2A activator n=1 Tax=Hondaea fermentalgiana TaxID=2315210 RepID=A0A2R5G872_9STRA|nr:Serine/threonine-protein phosphatase 2A activator [Hondaea fermentalgiana]|eukprot:GBG26745.1 Serine/threonine-protein phosphatase 2A activator [Hondaea fermentalgiana]
MADVADSAPVRRIVRPEHLNAFLSSPTYERLETFVGEMNSAAQGGKPTVAATYEGGDSGVQTMLDLIEHVEQMLEEHPPIAQQAARFGNAAFRSWMEAVEKSSVDDMSALSEEHAMELAGYWCGSFGNARRLDFGTGHEASFLVWLFASREVGVVSDLEGLVLAVFPRYLELVYAVQTLYRLEPAGSHGVWSLDDFHILPFVFGSAQLCPKENDPTTAGSLLGTRPRSSRDRMMVEDMAGSSMYMRAIKRITELKTGPFEEHSPLLTDIAQLPSWKKVNAGLIAMFKGEVLAKFPVAQHFLFGPHFPCTWEVDSADLSALETESTATGRPSATGASVMSGVPSPFEAALRMPANGDALTKYFGVSRRPIVGPGRGRAPVPSFGAGAGASNDATETTAAVETAAVAHTLLDDERGVEVAGFRIETNKTRISGESELDSIRDEHTFEGHCLDFPLPEMLFGLNIVRFTHLESGVSLEFNAADALCGCKIVRAEDGTPDRTLFKLPNAADWENRQTLNGETIKSWRDDFDWTFTTRYKGSLSVQDEPRPLPSPEDGVKIDYQLLRKREPFLYFESVPLFEDDLFDFGESKLSVRVRAMTSCFFALSRFWLRVDNHFVRCFDTRVFFKYGADHMVIEHTRKEMSAKELADKGFGDMRIMMNEERVEKLLREISRETIKIPLTASE